MPIIKLPDGNSIEFPKKVTGLEVAEKISKSLSKQATIISAAFDKDLLIFSAISSPVTPLENLRFLPSGSLIIGI